MQIIGLAKHYLFYLFTHGLKPSFGAEDRFYNKGYFNYSAQMLFIYQWAEAQGCRHCRFQPKTFIFVRNLIIFDKISKKKLISNRNLIIFI